MPAACRPKWRRVVSSPSGRAAEEGRRRRWEARERVRRGMREDRVVLGFMASDSHAGGADGQSDGRRSSVPKEGGAEQPIRGEGRVRRAVVGGSNKGRLGGRLGFTPDVPGSRLDRPNVERDAGKVGFAARCGGRSTAARWKELGKSMAKKGAKKAAGKREGAGSDRSTVMARLTQEEVKQVRIAAAIEEKRVGEFVRDAVLSHAAAVIKRGLG